MPRENNFHPDSGICRRLFKYIINGLTIIKFKGLYTPAKSERGDDQNQKISRPNPKDRDAGCEIKVDFKKTDDDQPEYRNPNNFVTVVPANDRPKIKIDVALEGKGNERGKKVLGFERTGVLDQPPEDPRPEPLRRRPVLLDVETNINEKSDEFIRRRRIMLDVESNINDNEKPDEFFRRGRRK